MSIRINIPNTRCRAGTTITGDVSIHGDDDVGVQLITIGLVARCKTKVTKSNGQSSTTYRGRAPLVHMRKDIFKGPHTLHPGHSWPFTCTLPTRCAARPTDIFKQTRGPFSNDPGQDLPPVFASSNHSFGWSAECFVRYELEASLVGQNASIFSSGDSQTTSTLDFITTRDVEHPAPQIFATAWPIACASLHLAPGREDDKLTSREKLKSIRTSKLPMAKFGIQVLLPKVAVLGKVFPVKLKLDHDIEGSSAPASPMVLLKKCTVQLHAVTHVQCIRDEIFREGDEQRDWEETNRIAVCDFSNRMDEAPAITELTDLNKLMQIGVPRHQRPTFNTFNIRRGYRLGITVTVECAQKIFKREFQPYGDFVVLAAEYVPRIDEALVASMSSAVEQFEAAPAYEDVPDKAPPRYKDAKQDF